MIRICYFYALYTQNYVQIALLKRKHAQRDSPSGSYVNKLTRLLPTWLVSQCHLSSIICVTVPSIIPVLFVPHCPTSHETTTLFYRSLLRDSTVVCMSASHTVGREFAPRPGHTKDHHKNGADCSLHAMQCVSVGVWQCSWLSWRPGSVCKTVYGDMHLKDLLGSIARVGYCITVLDFYLVFRCWKSTIMD